MRPSLVCQNCEELIPLLTSTLERKPILPTWWPSDKWTRNFLCLECKHLSVYTARDVRWRPAPTSAQDLSTIQNSKPGDAKLLVIFGEYPCATRSCKHLLKVLVVVDTWPPTDSDLATTVARAHSHNIFCPVGHEARFQSRLHVQWHIDPDWWAIAVPY